MMLQVPIVSDSVCRAAMSSVDINITSDMLCAGLLLLLIAVIDTTIIIDTIIFIKLSLTCLLNTGRGEWQGFLWGEFLLGFISPVEWNWSMVISDDN